MSGPETGGAPHDGSGIRVEVRDGSVEIIVIDGDLAQRLERAAAQLRCDPVDLLARAISRLLRDAMLPALINYREMKQQVHREIVPLAGDREQGA